MLQVLVGLLDADSPVESVAVVTFGAAGAMAIARSGVLTRVASLPVDVISSTAGAGDAFNAGFLHEWVTDHGDLQSALQGGAQTAAQALTRVGASPSAEN
jgi:sugar/nucleoside kinase (ribokinase family)